MREKKSRAWDKVTEIYLYSDKFPSMWQFYKELENRGIRHFETEDYIGIQDTQGKEIYEGAIAKYKYPSSHEYFEGVIEYVDMDLEIGWEHDETRFVGFVVHSCIGTEDEYFTPIPSKASGIQLEVIGNIRENPELVK